MSRIVKELASPQSARPWGSPAFALMAVLAATAGSASAADTKAPRGPVPIVVFDFRLDDQTPASDASPQATDTAAALARMSGAARRELERSGKYRVIEGADAPPVATPPQRAAELGAQQYLLGLVTRANPTDYYISIVIHDVRTGKLVTQQSANFAGSEEGWASGVRMLLDHQLLYVDQPGRLSSSDETECRQAVVNPVSGFAECVEPRGAPVGKPPPRPDSASPRSGG